MENAQVENLVKIFDATLRPETTMEASKELIKCKDIPGFLLTSLHISINENLSDEIRLAAAIQFKKGVLMRWSQDGVNPSFPQVIPEEKEVIRDEFFNALLSPVIQIRNQMEDALIRLIGDFPEKWAKLPSLIIEALQNNQKNVILGGLVCLRSLCKEYNYRKGDPDPKLFEVINYTFPLIFNILSVLTKHDNSDPYEIQYWVVKTLFEHATLGIPGIIKESKTLDEWMAMMIHIFISPTANNSDKFYWKTKRIICDWFLKITFRFQRIKSGKSPEESPEEIEFANFWLDKYPSEFLEKCFEFLLMYSNKNYVKSRLLHSILEYVHNSISISILWARIKPHIFGLLESVILPLLSYSSKDAELFENEPMMWINESKALGDFYDPRQSAIQIIYEIVVSRKDEWLEQIVNWLLINVLQPYSKLPFQQRNTSLKYGCLVLLANLSRPLKRSTNLAGFLENLLIVHVFPELESPYPFMQAKAAWLLGHFICTGSYLANTNFAEVAVQPILHLCLESTALPVKCEAMIALYDFIPLKETRKIIGPLVPRLLTQYLKVIDLIKYDEIVSSLQYMMRYFPRAIEKSSMEIMKVLVKAFHSSYQAASNDDLSEDDNYESEEEDLDLKNPNFFCTCDQIIKTIHTLYRILDGQENLFIQFEPLALSIINTSFDNQNPNFIENILELFTMITYITKVPFTKDMWDVFPKITKSNLSFSDYLPEFTSVLENYIGRDIESFLSPGTPYVDCIFQMAKSTIENSNTSEYDCAFMIEFLKVFILCSIGRIDQYISPLLQIINYRLQFPSSDNFQVMSMEVYLNALWYNPELTLHSLGDRSYSFLQLTLDLIAKSKFVRFCDKKTAILGFSRLLKIPYEILSLYVHDRYLDIFKHLLELTKNADIQLKEIQALEEDSIDEAEEDSYGNISEIKYDSDLYNDDEFDDEINLDYLVDKINNETRNNSCDENKDVASNLENPLTSSDVNFVSGNQWDLMSIPPVEELPTDEIDPVVYFVQTLNSLPNRDAILLALNEDEKQKYLYLINTVQERM